MFRVTARCLASCVVMLAACRHARTPAPVPPAPAAPAPARAARPAVAPAPARVCEAKTTRTKPSSSGEATVTGRDGTPRSLYWIKLDAKQPPSRGTVFYLAGGPISHMEYTDLAAGFQRVAYPDRDVVLYDYYGFNCSTAIQTRAGLEANVDHLTMAAMASDFIQLKRQLVGKAAKIVVMGGSHGAMLGSAIVGAYPAEIAKAVLFSGDTQSGWLDEGWYRFDALMTKLDAANPGFAAGLEKLLASAPDRPMLEVGMWIAFSLDASAQASLPELVKLAQSGQRWWIDNVVRAARTLLDAPHVEPPPTDSSLVTTFHRCNVWWPRSRRTASQRPTRFFRHEDFVTYWNKLCRDDDRLGEHPLIAPRTRTHVPILAWVGDQDTFDPVANRAHWEALSSDVTFQVMPGWSHDFGTDPKAGFQRVAKLVAAFLARDAPRGPAK